MITNPYHVGSLAYDAWNSVRAIFNASGATIAVKAAENFDRNLNLGLKEQVVRWATE